MPSRHRVPIWLMGLTNLSYCLYGGVVAFAVPQLLGEREVPEAAIAGLTAVAFSPGFWAFLLSPILDVRFSRRWYAVALAVVASLTLVVAFLNLDHLALLETLLTIGFFAAYLYQSSVGGWLSTITSGEEEKYVSVWMTIGNVGGFGVMAVVCGIACRKGLGIICRSHGPLGPGHSLSSLDDSPINRANRAGKRSMPALSILQAAPPGQAYDKMNPKYLRQIMSKATSDERS